MSFLPVPTPLRWQGAMASLVCLAMMALFLTACTQAGTTPPACREQAFDKTPFIVCSFDPQSTDIRLFHTAPDGEIYGQFDRLAETLEGQGETLLFAMNAGMYHKDRSPVGLYVEDHKQASRLQLGESPGNFGMVPNGVFVLGAGSTGVYESEAFARMAFRVPPRFVTQSGPMLVIDGELHPAFNADGTSKHRRNGVGVSADGIVHFAVSDVPVNFHTFARLFRDELNTPNALYLDGKVSKIYSAELARNEKGLDMGPIVAVVETEK